MELEESLVRYKEVTLNIFQVIKSEKYEELDKCFEKRQMILDNISKNYSKDELKRIYFELELDKIDKKLASEIEVKKEDLLKKIKENKKRQRAMNGYNSLSTRAVFLSKEF